jgi:isopentenyl-diphosphate delta-isomerase
VAFREKTNGFEQYDFIHCSITEVEIENIDLSTKFLGKKISLPFLISCMTGGTEQSENINAQLAIVAEQLNIPIGVGSQRRALESGNLQSTYSVIRKNAPTVPVLANIGAAEVVKYKNIDPFKRITEMINADGLVIHLNPLQELLQPEGTPHFSGLLTKIKFVTKQLNVPVIVKEVGSGISYNSARELLDAGVKGIDVAGAGGTSWAGVEILRSSNNSNSIFWDWGLPTSYCIREVSKLKQKFKFTLIGSGGINSAMEAAKAIALGADIVASARTILQALNKIGIDGTKELIVDWFENIKRIMFLTGSFTLKEFRKNKIARKEMLL